MEDYKLSQITGRMAMSMQAPIQRPIESEDLESSHKADSEDNSADGASDTRRKALSEVKHFDQGHERDIQQLCNLRRPLEQDRE